MTDYTELREEFVRLCTIDSEDQDGRKRGFNQAIFSPDTGQSVWAPCTDLEMVLEKFDKAVKNINRKRRA